MANEWLHTSLFNVYVPEFKIIPMTPKMLCTFFIILQIREILFYHFIDHSRAARNGRLHKELCKDSLFIKDKFWVWKPYVMEDMAYLQ